MDDATHEAIAVVPGPNISGRQLVRMLEDTRTRCGYPKVVRADNGKEVLRSSDADLVAREARPAAADLARKAEPDDLRRIIN